MKNKMKLLCASIVLFSSAAVFADDVKTPVAAGQQGASYANEPRPRGGMTMDQVTSQFGEPSQTLAAVGDPPITRWVYAHYTVYFEKDRVIHSVLNTH